ncbi:YtzH-like family protein [Sutcliffiella horikoshii]|uniref:YtzH-like family protein n=1 Tax=Sutcliffiella horikoshii TaxID=79883 RepID=UPI001CFE6DA2|nr:YtzH-like family protein [Sutcliffiella horikoshii]
MPLNYHDQIHLLKDILADHQIDCCGSVAEYEQLERVIKSLMVNNEIDQNVKNILQDIYSYSQGGINSSNDHDHNQLHQSKFTNWIDSIDQYS